MELLFLLGIFIAFGVGGRFWKDELIPWLIPLLGEFQAYIEGAGLWGAVLYIGLYIVWILLGLPEVIIALLGGVAFESQPMVAIICISSGSTLGGALCFMISRYFGQNSFQQWIGKKGVFTQVERLITRHGVWAVAIVRLTPIFPLNLINYGFGLTNIDFWKFLLVSWICILPTATFYVLLTVSVLRVLRGGRVPWDMIGVAAAILIFMLLFIAAAAVLRKKKM